ncbi:uncharacterized protein ACIBXB_014040 [Morphnus guianensis]
MTPFKLSAARLSTWQGGRAASGQMFSFCGQKAGLGKGAVPEAHPHNETLPTQATLGPDLPRRWQAGTARVAATLGLPQEQRFSLGSSGDPRAGGEEPSLVGARKRAPGFRRRDGDTLVPPTQPTSEARWHPLSPAAWLSVDALLKGGGQPAHLGVIAGDPCAQAGIAEVAVASFPPTHMYTPHNREGPNHLFIKISYIPGPKHRPAMPAGGLRKEQRIKSPNPRPRFGMYPLKLMNLYQGWKMSVVWKRQCFVLLSFTSFAVLNKVRGGSNRSERCRTPGSEQVRCDVQARESSGRCSSHLLTAGPHRSPLL